MTSFSGAFLWCYVCFVLLRFRLHAFIEVVALRSIVLRYAGAPLATRVSFFLFSSNLFGDVDFSRAFLGGFPAVFLLRAVKLRTVIFVQAVTVIKHN